MVLITNTPNFYNSVCNRLRFLYNTPNANDDCLEISALIPLNVLNTILVTPSILYPF